MIIQSSLSFVILLSGFYGLIMSRNIVKSIICLNIIQTSLILLFINLSQSMGEGLPIAGIANVAPVDPLPQALMITAIVIGASITALSLMLTVKIFHYYGTLDWHDILKRLEANR